eukprot:TRINITY_DN10032_c0_g1_i1.p1 TRINITY_DN10032_c0_g1~~TRINITY_DN10032_c0_g1_i1.p1  ORF type:complete len:804 (+),score=191.72 TRINITY_DN10032_c0_g1_i1:77-2413(+)
MDLLNDLRVITVLFVKLENVFFDTKTKQFKVPTFSNVVAAIQTITFHLQGYLKFLVDDKGILVVLAFGTTPYSHGDDSVRGVVAALRIIQTLGNHSIQCNIGITTGRAFCGWVGSIERREYTIVGDIVNLSARLMAASEKLNEKILCDKTTYNATKNNFQYTQLDAIQVKGKTEMIDIFVPLKNIKVRKGKSSRIGVAHQNVTLDINVSPTPPPRMPIKPTTNQEPDVEASLIYSPRVSVNVRKSPATSSQSLIIGRKEEKRIIDNLLDQLSLSHISGCVVIEGGVGMGKSALLNFGFTKGNEIGLRCVAGQAESLDRSTPLLLWRAIFSQLFVQESGAGSRSFLNQSFDSNPNSMNTQKIMSIVRQKVKLDQICSRGSVSLKLKDLLSLLNPLFNVRFTPSIKLARLSADAKKQLTEELLIRLLKGICFSSPLVIFLDNCQWMDSSSIDFTCSVMNANLAILLVLATRTEWEARSRFYGHGQWLWVGALSAEDTEQLVCTRLNVLRIPTSLRNFIERKSQGNPLLSEELAKCLLQLGMISVTSRGSGSAIGSVEVLRELEDLELSENFQGLVTSCLDSLPARLLLLLKVASVIGREFDLETLSAVFPVQTDLSSMASDLQLLIKRDFLATVSPCDSLIPTTSERVLFTIKSSVVSETCYNIMPFSQKLRLHRNLGEWYEKKKKEVGEGGGSFNWTLAHHWTKVAEHREAQENVIAKAIDYLFLLGQECVESLSVSEGLRALLKAEALLKRLPESFECPHRFELPTAIAQCSPSSSPG